MNIHKGSNLKVVIRELLDNIDKERGKVNGSTRY